MQIGFISKEKDGEPFLLTKEKYIEAGRYSISKERVAIISTIIEYGLFVFWINDGFQILQQYIVSDDQTTKTVLFVFGFIIFNSIITFPIDVYQKFVIDQRHGFNKSTYALFLLDTLKELILTVIIGVPIVIWLAYFMETAELWWLWSFLVIFGLIIFANMLYPTLIAPLFNKMTPLKNGELKDDIENLLKRVGFQSSGVFSVDASKRDSRLNAYFGGLGKSKRVVLFDTLIEKLQPIELIAVLGHELGHFKHGDIYKNIAVMGTLLFGLFYGLGHIPDEFFAQLGMEKSSEMLIVTFMLFMPVATMVIMPIFGVISRHNEFEADRMGSELSGNPIYLKEALKKLVVENRAFPKSHPLYIFFYYTHPPVADRLEELGREK
jgi:STE24 endopeptidase